MHMSMGAFANLSSVACLASLLVEAPVRLSCLVQACANFFSNGKLELSTRSGGAAAVFTNLQVDWMLVESNELQSQ